MSWDRLTQSITPLPTWQENHASLIEVKWIPLTLFYQFQFSCPVHQQWEDAGTCPDTTVAWGYLEISGKIMIKTVGPGPSQQVIPAPPEYIWRYRNNDQDYWHYDWPYTFQKGTV